MRNQQAEEEMRNQMRYEEVAGNEGGDMPNDKDDANNEDDDDEILRGPFPGGPIDTSVLRSFKTHIAAAIWRGEEREVLKCHCLTAKLLRWQPAEDSSVTWKTLVKTYGLLRLRKLAYRAPNRNLVSAFVERIKGRPVEFAWEDVVGGQHMWLHSRFSVLASSEDDFEVVYTARAYLVYILGCTLFTDKTGDQITCNYLRLFEDPEEQMGGFLTLLEPFAMRWAQQAHGAVFEDAVRAYRLQLDTLRAEDVLRQFRWVQTIPHPPLDPVVFRRGKKPGQYRVVWGMLASFYEQWESHNLARERRGRVVYPAWACSPDYQQWYESISHPRVHPEAAAPIVDPPMTVSPWDGIQSAVGYLEPVLTRWRAHDRDLSLPYVMSQVEEAFEALHFRTGHEHSETHSHREHEQGESSSR
ncbi:hypothetical protein C2S52_012386 [Perilla frutescens var. hirtella]|nr:hypothetical protein C2S52_012386 [Perilla frutescens var. hirtella]